jgi:hypothetical protein
MILHYGLTQYILISLFFLALIGIIISVINAGHPHKS